jgi:hypothetical protein
LKTYTLDWKGWWLLRPEMSAAADLKAPAAVYAVVGAKLRKVAKGIVCSAREPVLFGVHSGPLRGHLAGLLKTSLGQFIIGRCAEIKKKPIVYAAALPDGADLPAILALVYGAVPFAPRHHNMPAPYKGEPVRILNSGRAIGLPADISFGVEKGFLDDDETHISAADKAMRAAMDSDAQATGIRNPDAGGSAVTERVDKAPELLPTEKVPKPQARLIDTEKVNKDLPVRGLATERVARPTGTVDDTEFVPRPKDSDEIDASSLRAGRKAKQA